MEKRNGFTLIELLAVIVILAIIALIATPIILNVIETAKQGAAENSALGYIEAVEKQIAINMIDSDSTNDINDGTYYIENLIENYNLKIKGEKVETGSWVTISNHQVSKYSIKIGNYVMNFDKDNSENPKETISNGTILIPGAITTSSLLVNKTEYNLKITDIDGNNSFSIGDKVEIGNEKFYIIDITANEIYALAYYNLNVGKNYSITKNGDNITANFVSDVSASDANYGIQLSSALGYNNNASNAAIAMDNNFLQDYVNAYVNYLKSNNNNINVTGAIPTYAQIENVAKIYTNNESLEIPDGDIKSIVPDWIYSTSYWCNYRIKEFTMVIVSDGTATGSLREELFGVRPVIRISKSLFE